MSEEKMLNNLDEINGIVLSNPICGELSLEKVSNSKLDTKQKYKEVFISELSLITGNVSQTALQVANQSMTLAQIAKEAPHGLFAATVNPSNLSKFANGTTTTMVRDASGHLVEHAGFAEVGLSVAVNPAIILSAGMQVMSAISGTYYLHKINTQIKDMDAKLEVLLNIHHDTNIGRLIAARKSLSEIANRDFVDTTDLSIIRSYKKTADEIHEEYNYRLKRQESEPYSKNDKKVIEKKHEEIYLTMTIAFEANKLSLYAELIEIATRMKIGSQIEIVNSLSRQLKRNYDNSFYHTIDSEIEKTYSFIRQRSSYEMDEKENKFNDSIDKFSDLSIWDLSNAIPKFGIRVGVAVKAKLDVNKTNKKIELESEKFNAIKSGMKQNKESDRIDNIINEVVVQEYKELEILYVPIGNNKQRVFVEIESNK